MSPDPVPFRSDRAARVRANPWLVAVSAMSGVGAPLAALLFGSPMLPVSFALVVLSFLALGALLERRWPKLDRRRLEADGSGVKQDGNLLIARSEITRGLALPLAGGCVVRLERRWPRSPLDVVVWNEEEGRQLLRALGLDASQTATDLEGGSGFAVLPWPARFSIVAGSMLGFFALDALFRSFGASLLFVLALFVFARFVVGKKSRIRVGVDGIHYRWLWQSRFVPFAQVRSMKLVPGARTQTAEVELAGGSSLRLPLGAGREQDEGFVYQRLLQGLEAFRARGGSAELELLARRGRPHEEWLRALRGLGAGATGPRDNHVDRERLWGVLDDPSAPPVARAGAAASLGASTEPGARERIRLVAAAVAEPRLRIAMETAAKHESSDEELAEALAEVEAAAAQGRAPGSE